MTSSQKQKMFQPDFCDYSYSMIPSNESGYQYEQNVSKEMSIYPCNHSSGCSYKFILSNSNEGKKRKRVISLESRRSANIRERRRMFHLNIGFDELRKRIPKFSYEKQLSRIETLRLAIFYINLMSEILESSDNKIVLKM